MRDGALALPEIAPEIRAADLEAYVKALSSADLAGSAPASEAEARAARYVAGVLARAGARPAGDDGSFVRAVPLLHARYTAPPVLKLVNKEDVEYLVTAGVDLSVHPRGELCSTDVLKVVRVAKEAHMPAGPDPEAALLLDGRPAEVRGWLVARGEEYAKGFGLIIDSPYGSTSPPGAFAEEAWALDIPEEEGCETVRIHGGRRSLFRMGYGARTVQLVVDGRTEHTSASSVIAVIPGRGTTERPELAAEALVLGVPRDRFGVREDKISGTAVALEIAGALAAAPAARTVVLVLAAEDDEGNWGLEHYLAAPVVPLERTVAFLGFNHLGRPNESLGRAGKVWMTGMHLSDLGRALIDSGIDVVADPFDDRRYWRTFDGIPLQKGLVAHTLSSYDLDAAAREGRDTLDYEHLRAATETALAAVRAIASGAITPERYADDDEGATDEVGEDEASEGEDG